MKKFKLHYNDVSDWGRPFDEDYKKWILENVKDKNVIVEFFPEYILICSDRIESIITNCIFIGFAFGQQYNGR